MVRACAKWFVTAYLVTIIAFSLLGLGSPPGDPMPITNLVFGAIVAAVYSPVFILPTALVAVLLDRYWPKRPPAVLLGLTLGSLAMAWSLWPTYVLIAAIAGGSAGWVAHHNVSLCSCRWLIATGLAGLMAGAAGLAALPLSSTLG